MRYCYSIGLSNNHTQLTKVKFYMLVPSRATHGANCKVMLYFWLTEFWYFLPYYLDIHEVMSLKVTANMKSISKTTYVIQWNYGYTYVVCPRYWSSDVWQRSQFFHLNKCQICIQHMIKITIKVNVMLKTKDDFKKITMQLHPFSFELNGHLQYVILTYCQKICIL
jgi:hypothetical protein